jgi:hypothetical protein
MAVVFVLGLIRPEFIGYLILDPRLAPSQPWRFFTFLFVPPDQSVIWIVFTLLFIHFVGASLEATWGAFKYNVYYFVGAVATVVAAYLTKEPRGNWYLNESLLWAVATIAPNYEILFFIIPLKLKWVALLGLVLVGFEAVSGDSGTRIAIAVSFANYLLFFGPELVAMARGRKRIAQQAARRAASAPPPPKKTSTRACAICGARQEDGADIRVCSCEKCGGKARELCLEHARNH